MSQPHDTVRRGSVLWIAMTALFMGMTILSSMLPIPLLGVNVYLCDVFINVAAILMDPLAAFFVGGVGAFLGDVFFYPSAMMITLLSHGLQALTVSFVYRHFTAKKRAYTGTFAIILGEIAMILGYTLIRGLIYNRPEIILGKMAGECIQGVFGAVVSVFLLYPMRLETTFHEMMRKQ